jgi:hypothetical protein
MVLFPEGLKALKDVAKEVGLDLRGAYFNLVIPHSLATRLPLKGKSLRNRGFSS